MCWNNGKERRKFEKVQSALAKQYRAEGMTEEQVRQMYEFDLVAHRSDRAYYSHTQALELCDGEAGCKVTDFLLEYYQATSFRNYSNRYWWIDELENLYNAAIKLPDTDKELLTLYVFDGFTQKEIAAIRNCDQATVSRQLNRIKKHFLAEQGGVNDEI